MNELNQCRLFIFIKMINKHWDMECDTSSPLEDAAIATLGSLSVRQIGCSGHFPQVTFLPS